MSPSAFSLRPLGVALLFLLAGTPSPLPAMSLAGNQNRREFMDQVTAAFVQEDYATLEATADELRATKDRSADGLWTLPFFYAALKPAGMQRDTVASFGERLAHWRAAYPQSTTMHIVEADALLDHQWDGEHLTLAPARERLPRARATLAEAEKLTPTPTPDWFDVALQLAKAAKMARPDYDALYARAIAAEPTYLSFYFDRARYLRDLGAAGGWEAFAQEAARQGNSGEGLGLYSRIFWSLCDAHADPAISKDAAERWPLLREGFRALDQRWPKSDWNLNNFCRFACLVGDRDTARELFTRIGDDWTTNWLSHAAFKEWKEWALSGNNPVAGTARRLVLGDPATYSAWAVRFSPDGGSLFAGYDDSRLVQWDLFNGTVRWQDQLGGKGSVDALAISPDGHWLAAGTAARNRRPNEPGVVRVWDLCATRLGPETMKRLPDGICGVHELRFSADGALLAAGGWNQIVDVHGEIRLWSLPNWQEVHHECEGLIAPMGMVFAERSSRRLAMGSLQSFHVVDTATWAHVFWPETPLHPTYVQGMDISPDGRTLACAVSNGFENRDQPGEVSFWDTSNWKRRETPHITAAGGIAAVTYSADGRWLAGGGYDGFLRVWDAATGKLAASWPPGPGAGKLQEVAFAPDNRQVAAVRDGDAVTVYAFNPSMTLGKPSAPASR